MSTPQDPPVVAWLRGKAMSYRRAATTAAKSGNPQEAEVYRLVAAQLGDTAADVRAYLEQAQP